MGRHTCLYDLHRALGARMMDYSGWDLPLAFGSQIEEHHAVRRDAGVFDVSHMGILDLQGPAACELLRRLLSNDAGRLRPGQALYSCMLNERGGVLDDLMVYALGPGSFRLVVNAATCGQDIAWICAHAQGEAVRLLERRDLAMLAVQGPAARERCAGLLAGEAAHAALALRPFGALALGEWLVARTGYTGEDGFEIMLPASDATALWRALNAAQVRPCGLGARDTLRLEAGLKLYGNDMDEQTDPFESDLGSTVAFEPPQREFIGRRALETLRLRGSARRLVGLVLEQPGVLRRDQRVEVGGLGDGRVTSGTFSPTLGRAIAFARVPAGAGSQVRVQLRDRWCTARVVRPPFVRHGRVLVQL